MNGSIRIGIVCNNLGRPLPVELPLSADGQTPAEHNKGFSTCLLKQHSAVVVYFISGRQKLLAEIDLKTDYKTPCNITMCAERRDDGFYLSVRYGEGGKKAYPLPFSSDNDKGQQ